MSLVSWLYNYLLVFAFALIAIMISASLSKQQMLNKQVVGALAAFVFVMIIWFWLNIKMTPS